MSDAVIANSVCDDKENGDRNRKKVKVMKHKKKASLSNITNISKMNNDYYKEGMKILVRWCDGLKYSAKIEKINEKSGSCSVRFDDSVLYSVLFKDVINEPTYKYREILCSICHYEESAEPNEIVLCDVCGVGYHQNCHKPEIGPESLVFNTKWECRSCIFARCTQKGGAVNTGEDAEAMRRLKKVLPYNLESLHWDKRKKKNKEQCYCYCGGPGTWFVKMIQCIRCNQWFHEACVQCLSHPLIHGDRLYVFVCSCCNDGHEYLRRLSLQWVQIAHLALFNLTLLYQRKYFDTHQEIEPWINTNWEILQTGHLHSTTKSERSEFLMLALLNTEIFRNGREQKKRFSLFGLRFRIPPANPKFQKFTKNTTNDDIQLLEEFSTDDSKLESPIAMSFKRASNYEEEIEIKMVKLLKIESPKKAVITEPQKSVSVKRKLSESFNNTPATTNNEKKKPEKNDAESISKVTPPRKKRKYTRRVEKENSTPATTVNENKKKGRPFRVKKKKNTLDAMIPWPSNYEGLNHPFKTVEEYNEEKAYELEKKNFINLFHSTFSSCGDTDSDMQSEVELPSTTFNSSHHIDKPIRETRRSSNIANVSNSLKSITTGLSNKSTNQVKKETIEKSNTSVKKEVPLHKLKNSDIFGAADRLVYGEKFQVLARRIQMDSSIQYLVQWNGIS